MSYFSPATVTPRLSPFQDESGPAEMALRGCMRLSMTGQSGGAAGREAQCTEAAQLPLLAVLQKTSSGIRGGSARLEVSNHARHRSVFCQLHDGWQRHPLTTGFGHEP